MSSLIEKARKWWKAEPKGSGIAHVPIDTVEAAPLQRDEEAKALQISFLQSIMSMERKHAEAMTALSKATMNHVRG